MERYGEYRMGYAPITVTIKPDGALTAAWGSTTAEGRVTVANGQAGYQMAPPPQEGTFKLYAGNGSTLYMENLKAPSTPTSGESSRGSRAHDR
jgi:hypothetical protein